MTRSGSRAHGTWPESITRHSELRVAMLTEGTYPFVDGGVSTWCHSLCDSLPTIEYSIYAVTGNPGAAERYPRTPNVKRVVQLPQWGTEEIGEYVQPGLPGLQYLRRKATARRSSNLNAFLDLFERVLTLILRPELTVSEDAAVIVGLHRFFQQHDYTTVFRARETWECFRDSCLSYLRICDRRYPAPSVLDLAIGLRWLHNLLMPVASPIPDVHLIHATVASPIGLMGIVARYERQVPFILTEHGVYVRERYIGVAPSKTMSPFLKRLLIGVASLAARLCYQHADVIAPVCSYNARWETRLGAAPERIEVIYNGINPRSFLPRLVLASGARRPTAVAAAKVSPIKDIMTMIRAAAVARKQIPDLLVRVYGSLTAEPAYVQQCRELIAQLGLEETFELAGYHHNPTEIYNEGEISVLSSISEGFPYTALESMACERPVVATDVGGVREALAGCGIVVPPRNPEALGRAMAELLLDPARRREMGKAARQRVMEHFRADQCAQNYLDLYRRMVIRAARQIRQRSTAAA